MSIQVPYKHKTILGLLFATVLMEVFSFLLFAHVGAVVVEDFYNYGLQFNSEWADLYWIFSYLFQSSLIIAILLTSILIVSFGVYIRKHSTVFRVACYIIPILGTAVAFFSIYFFYRISYIIHYDLYQFGLHFSPNWAGNYWPYAISMFTLIGFQSATTLASMALIFLGAQKLVKINPPKLIASTLIITGAVAIALSIYYVSSILAFIGLGLVFWGIILTYVRSEEYAKKIVLDTTVSSQQATVDYIMRGLKYKNDVIYLPPKYFKNSKIHRVYLPRQKNAPLPRPEQIQEREQDFRIEKLGALLTPVGAELSKFFEKTLGTNFADVNLRYLQNSLPKLLIEDLEIAQDFEMEVEKNKIHVKIKNSVYRDLTVKTEHPSRAYAKLGSPLSSAIACVLAKTTGKPIIIEKEQNSEDGKDVTIVYRLLDEEVQTEH